MAEGNMPQISEAINCIIESESRDAKQIEELLDILLNYGFLGVGKSEYYRLNEYYRTFDEEAYNDWKHLYEEDLRAEE